jgi:dTDP-4-dehydrorhamnose 3,5-epimerase
MISISQPLYGVHLLQPNIFKDHRGKFIKTYHSYIFEDLGISFSPQEEFISTSHKGVLRGMHFQLPPHDHAKLVFCISGRVLDVLLDIRRGSPTYGQTASAELSEKNHYQFYIPKGIAHGFLSLEDNSVMVYKSSSVHSSSHDTGIAWNSFGFAWPKMQKLILSERDQKFASFSQFNSPFENLSQIA